MLAKAATSKHEMAFIIGSAIRHALCLWNAMPRAMRAQPNLLLAKIAEHKRIPGILIETEFANHLATEPSFESRAAHDGHVVSFSSAYMAKLGGPWLFVLLGALSGYGGVQIVRVGVRRIGVCCVRCG